MTDELMALLAKATPGEWFSQPYDGSDTCVSIISGIVQDGEVLFTPTNGLVAAATMLPTAIDDRDPGAAEANAAAIVAAVNFCRNEVPALIAEVERLRGALARMTAKTADYESAIIRVGRGRERAAIIKWLRGHTRFGFPAIEAANSIDRGDHIEAAVAPARLEVAPPQGAVAQLADALGWALREIDGENEYRKGHQQIHCRQNAETVLALWRRSHDA